MAKRKVSQKKITSFCTQKEEEKEDTAEQAPKRKRSAPAEKEKPAGAPMNKTATDYSKINFECTKLSKEGKPWNFKISTWNVVSLKALAKKSGLEYVRKEDPDIMCFQETKCGENNAPEEAKIDGYHRYFASVYGCPQGPTLVYHDGSDQVEEVVRCLGGSRPVLVVQSPERPAPHTSHTPQSTVLLAASPEPFLLHLRLWSLWNGRSRVLVVLERGGDVLGWLRALWKWTRAVDVVVMVLADIPEFYTWFPYQPEECSNVTTITKLNSTSLYPKKIGSYLHNCPLIAVTSHFPPTVVVDDFRGIEPRIFHTLAKKVGMRASYRRLPPGAFVWSVFNLKWEPTNGLKLLWENQVDVMFGNLYGLPHLYADSLRSHTMDSFVWFVPGPRPAARATAIYRAFSPRAWVYVLGACAIIFLTVGTLPYLENGEFEPSFLHSLAIILSLPSPLRLSRIFQLFTVAAYIYSMHITTAYQSSLLVFLSDVPRERPIKTFEDLVASRFKVEFLEAHRSLVMRLSESPLFATLSEMNRTTYQPILHLDSVASPGNNALLGPKLSYIARLGESRFYDEAGFPLVRVLQEPVETIYMRFYLSKGHPLVPLFDVYTERLIEAGLPLRYAYEVMKPQRPSPRQREAFGIKNVEGPFFLLLVMLAFSSVVWLLEWFVYAFQNNCKRSITDSEQQNRMTLRVIRLTSRVHYPFMKQVATIHDREKHQQQ